MTIVAPPSRSLEQRLVALRHANHVRVLRAQLKREMTRDRAVLTVLRPPEYAATMRVWDLLASVPKVGPVRVKRIMGRVGISHHKTLAGLSDRQRGLLAKELDS